jgi:MoxR-like ATPase
MAIDFKTFGSFINTVADAKHPVLIRGRHGVGKSETVYAFAKSIGKRVVERRASQMTEGDLVGLPVVEGNRTSWNPPDWFKDACDNGVVLFMDEIDRAVQEV